MSSIEEAPPCPALVIDGSSACFFAGILDPDGKWLARKAADAPALESLFETVRAVLDAAELELGQIRSYIYCEGPGSVLGLRLCAMAIETWRRIHSTQSNLYAYNSLRLTAARLAKEASGQDALLISDWKKDTWNGLKIVAGKPEGVAPVNAGELSRWEGTLYHLPARKGWQRPPENAIELTYQPESLADLIHSPALIEQRERVELYNSGINTFQKWTPERHRAISQRSGDGENSSATPEPPGDGIGGQAPGNPKPLSQ